MKKGLIIKKRYAKITPAKIKIVGREIVGLNIDKAILKLTMIEKRGAIIIRKMLKEFISNHDNVTDQDKFMVKSIRTDKGPVLKRHLPRSRGRISPFRRISSHITIEFLLNKNNKNGTKSQSK